MMDLFQGAYRLKIIQGTSNNAKPHNTFEGRRYKPTGIPGCVVIIYEQCCCMLPKNVVPLIRTGPIYLYGLYKRTYL